MVNYENLRRKFPNRDPRKAANKAAIRAIAREYERKRAELGDGPPLMRKGIVFYAVVIIGLLMLGSLVLSATGRGGRERTSKALLQANRSVESLAKALGRYRFHVGEYPTTGQGLPALAAIMPHVKGWNGPYTSKIVPDPWGHDYVYELGADGEPVLYSPGPDGKAGTTDDILPDRKLFGEAFADTTWTNRWMPYQLRGLVVAPDEEAKRRIQAEVRQLYGEGAVEIEGEKVLSDGWEFKLDWKDTSPASRRIDGDGLWHPVRIPHDWAIEGPFAADLKDGNTGKLPWRGKGSYRLFLDIPSAAKGRFVALRFGGVMSRPEVFLNGERVGGWDYGYMSFEVDVSGRVRFGERNELLVKVDTTSHHSRWYPGAGIYRDVKLVIEDPEDRALYGSVKITTPKISAEEATVRVEYLTPVTSTVIVNEFTVKNPRFWDVNDPYLYTTRICGKDYRYGIRRAEFTADDGFHLNGRRVQLRGVNLHSDLGPLGMAFSRDAMRRQLERMKDMGVNALRTSHNACDPQVLDLCDELGIVVWNECFDKWDGTAGIRADEKLEEVVSRNLRQFVRRDRNHPSVVVWSIGNEIRPADENDIWGITGSKDNLYAPGTTRERCRLFREAVRSEDATRPVGMGCCFQSAIAKGHYDDLDLTGWNYGEQYRQMRGKYPAKPVVYSESASAFSSAGYYPDAVTVAPTNYGARLDIDAYDRCAASWADLADVEFVRMERDRYCAGEFVWTGIDYLGEPSPFGSASRSSYFGACDLMGMPKDRFYLYRSHWNDRAETVHLLPHWNWDGREGQRIPVACYTSGDEAELFLNGESQGRRKKALGALPEIVNGAGFRNHPGYYGVLDRYRLTWEVPYEAGEIKVIAYRNGRPVGEASRRTAGPAAAVRLVPERAELPVDGIGFVGVELVDAQGTPLPLAEDRVEFAVEGPGEILAVGNSSEYAGDSFRATGSHPLHFGRAAVVVRRLPGPATPVVLKASAKGVTAARVELPIAR